MVWHIVKKKKRKKKKQKNQFIVNDISKKITFISHDDGIMEVYYTYNVETQY